MKKFFSLFCAVAIVLSASAVPAKQLTGSARLSKSYFEKQQVEKPVVKKAAAHQVAPVTLKNVKASKVATNRVPGAQLAPSAIKHAPAAIKRAPAAKQETFDVAIAEYSTEYYASDGDVYVIMYDATRDYAFTFDIYVAAGTSELALNQTYTLADMWATYTGAYQYDYAEDDYFSLGAASAASLVKTADAEGLVRIEASLTLENGDIYNLVYQEEPLPVATDTINVVFAAEEVELTDFTATSGIFQFVGENANGAVYAAFKGNQIAGTYSGDQLYLDYTAIYQFTATDTIGVDVLAGDAVITFADDTFHVDAYYLGQDAHCYHVQMAYYEEPFVPTGDTINVVISEPMTISYYKSDGDWWMRGANAEYSVKIDVVNHDSVSPAGTYATEDALASYTYVTEVATDTKLNLMELEATVTEANNRIDVVADMLCDDGNVYHITMFYAAPEAQNFDTIVATNLQIEEESFYGYVFGYDLIASDENYEVALSIDSDQDGIYVASGSITDIATGVASKVYSGSITLATLADGNRVVTGDVLCMNNTLYTLDLTYIKPEPTSQETLNGAGILYLLEQDGMYYWQALAMNADETRYISLLAITDGEDAGTYSKADLYAQYTYAGKFVGTDTTWYDMFDANITLAINNDVATITGTFVGKNENDASDITEFILNLTLMVEDERGGGQGGNQYDSQDTPFKHIFAEYEVDDQYAAQYNVLIAEAQDAENNYISLEFNVAEGVTELPVGVYDIDESYEAGTVSAGYINQNIYGSFGGSIDAEGYIAIPLWLMVDGTVTVHANGVITVKATNTWGVDIECQLGQWPEAIENTDAAAGVSKRIVNGQLVIEKNGVKYNAVGTIVK